ncbi:MAG: hypothetical protein K2M08_02715 [Anaeroplasmataceae bacterium]|nr:hypothetical protein [Anaeroplasmataceae bacterium]
MQKKLFFIFSGLFILLEILLLVVALTTKNSRNVAFVLNVFIAISLFGISLFFPNKLNLVIRYICLLVLWGIHMSIVIGTNLWDNSSVASIFTGLFAQHFILTIASMMPTERFNINKYLFFIEVIICFISLAIFPLAIPLAFFAGDKMVLVVTLGTLTFIGEIGIVLFKQLKLEN